MAADPYPRAHRSAIRRIDVAGTAVGGGAPLLLIAGPCVVEETSVCLEIAEEARRVCREHGVTYLFKASYDKANKTIAGSYRGPGWREGLARIAEVKARLGVAVLTDVHEPHHCAPAAEVADVLQIPALLSKQIDLILAAAGTGRPVNVKKGLHSAPWEMRNVIERLAEHGHEDVMVTERGALFGYQTLISDPRALPILARLGRPVVFDASHSVHGNEVLSRASGIEHRGFIAPLARAAAAIGVDGLFVEVHPDPDRASSDAQGTLALDDLEPLVAEVVALDRTLSERTRDRCRA